MKYTRSIMDSSTRISLCHQINVFLKKFPNASDFEIRKFLLTTPPGEVNLCGVFKHTLKSFIFYQRKKLSKPNSCLKRLQGSGSPKSVSENTRTV